MPAGGWHVFGEVGDAVEWARLPVEMRAMRWVVRVGRGNESASGVGCRRAAREE